MSADPIALMVEALQPVSAEQRRRAKNARYYERHKDRWWIYKRVRELRELLRVLRS